MSTDPAQTHLEPTRSHVTDVDPVRDSEIAGDATILRDSSAPAGATLVEEGSDGSTQPGSSAGDFQLSWYFAQEAVAKDPSSSDEDLHGARCPRFGRFVLLELLGRGGMGEVYRALHVRLRKQAAIKLLPLERAANPEARERFQREIRIISGLKHPNIVRLENAGEIDGLPYLVMEYIPGLDLEQLVGRLGPLPVADACQLVGQAAVGLSHIHQQGLVHRDLKPSNLILSTDGALKIADLGLARLAEGESPITAEGTLLGDPHYMAPEQVDGSGPVDIRSDIYALGCTLFTLLTGRPPFADAGADATKVLAAHLYQAFPPITEHRDGIPAGLQKILQRMTARQPSKRYASPGEVAAALATFAQGCEPASLFRRLDIVPREATRGAGTTVGSAEYLTSSGEFPSRGTSRRWLIPVVCVVAGVLLTVGALFGLNILNRSPSGDSVIAGEAPEPVARPDDTLANSISTVPADWRDASKDDVEEHSGGSGPGPSETVPLLEAIDARRDTFMNAEVSSAGDGIILSADKRGIVQLPVQPPASYTLQMVVERISGTDSIGIGVNAGSGRLLALVDHVASGTPTTGLMHAGSGRQLLDEHDGRLLTVGQRTRIEMDVTPSQVCLRVEDPLALEESAEKTSWVTSCWDGSPTALTLSQFDAYYPGVLFLHAYESSFHLHELAITEPDGKPATPLFDGADGDERRLAERILWRGGRVQLLTADGESWFDRLEALPEETWIIGIEPRDVSPSLRLDNDDLRGIAALTVGLKTLDLRSTGVTDDGLGSIDEMSSLEWLGLSGSHLTGAGLSQIQSLPALKTIYLNGTSIGDTGLEVLSRFPTLALICVSNSDVTDAGVMELSGALPELHHLCLNYTRVNGDCLPSLASFPKLAELNLAKTYVKDEDLPALYELPALTEVDLRQTKVSKQGVAELLEERPGLEVSQ